ncbi:cytochrome P450 [Mycena albidolilacea]|uniref:Cytochrome P450 n=1 Tax=Mycena albidolilacea TaxID=1033008 RepID=A0AAD6ZPU0_9AGAR|nr:cytochrome P450 [Mycena albidolilacea]
MIAPTYGEYERLKTYGSGYSLKGCFDPLASQYILSSPHIGLSPTLQNMGNLVFGEGNLFVMRGKEHKRLRNEFNTAFTAGTTHSYTPMLERVGHGVADKLELTSDTASINIMPVINNAALTAMTEAALGYLVDDFEDRYVSANAQIMAAASDLSPGKILADALGTYLPEWILHAAVKLPTRTFNTDLAQQGSDITGDIFGALLNPDRSDTTRTPSTGEEIITQTQLLMIAGHETTATTVAFAFWELARNEQCQDMLRAEIHWTVGEAGSGNIPYDRMPLLNAFIKEVLRLYPAEPFTERMALQDTIMPLSETITTATGDQISQVPLHKGDILIADITSYQRLESRWGEDAHEFRPFRWIDGEVSKGEAVGPYANLLTFLGGPYICLEWRLAILEMQILISELVGNFAFAIPENDPITVRLANTLPPP